MTYECKECGFTSENEGTCETCNVQMEEKTEKEEETSSDEGENSELSE